MVMASSERQPVRKLPNVKRHWPRLAGQGKAGLRAWLSPSPRRRLLGP